MCAGVRGKDSFCFIHQCSTLKGNKNYYTKFPFKGGFNLQINFWLAQTLLKNFYLTFATRLAPLHYGICDTYVNNAPPPVNFF
ncbi:hypothetical protein GDO78_012932 [Eleutherodactylus coqui]|uniref:Uncharacterized protein n=1 Tax=Eleutherodactylus coqui TaxID=57060 RepID=A0A8J6EX57_ELECQ|nr:hypothetical protein GDO78_012932 [Eleutherodactylus coqui]